MFNSIQTEEDYKLFVRTHRCNYTDRDCKNCAWRFKHYTPDYVSECFLAYNLKAFKYLVHYDIACNMIDQASNIVKYLCKHNKLNSKYYLVCNKESYEIARDYLEKYKGSIGIAIHMLMRFDNDIEYGLVRLRKNK